uniref:Endonuclease/exonuclease/phosphatase domain-containing protein n=1 Tax=Denticeps clupeoides TaxID=299321 RepID=A0AAY4ASN6_9TELE
ICFNRCPGNVVASKADVFGHWIVVVLNVEGHFIILCNVYGYATSTENKLLLSKLTDVFSELKDIYKSNFIVVGGDYNLTPDDCLDRCPSRFHREINGNKDFVSLINDTKNKKNCDILQTEMQTTKRI